jgi:hypothetical protein
MITTNDIFKADLETLERLANHVEETISLEVTAELIDTSNLSDGSFRKALENLHGKLFAINHNTGGENYRKVANMYFNLPDQFLVRITIANFMQNEPHNIPDVVLEILSETFNG